MSDLTEKANVQYEPCPVCDGQTYQVLWDCFRGDASDERALECGNCRLVRRGKTQEGFPELQEFYRETYRKEYFRTDKAEVEKLIALFGPYQETRLDRLGDLIAPGKSVLEIGCGSGYFLDAARRRGLHVRGIELDEAQAQFACDELEIAVTTDPIETTDFGEEKFDLIFLLQVLEHIEDPVNFLSSISQNLNRDGRLVVEVPNLDNPLVSLFGVSAFKNFWYQKPHLFYFNSKTLASTLSHAGFSVSSIATFQEMGLVNHINWMVSGSPMPSRDVATASGLPASSESDFHREVFDALNAGFSAADESYKGTLQQAGFGDILLGVFEPK